MEAKTGPAPDHDPTTEGATESNETHRKRGDSVGSSSKKSTYIMIGLLVLLVILFAAGGTVAAVFAKTPAPPNGAVPSPGKVARVNLSSNGVIPS